MDAQSLFVINEDFCEGAYIFGWTIIFLSYPVGRVVILILRSWLICPTSS